MVTFVGESTKFFLTNHQPVDIISDVTLEVEYAIMLINLKQLFAGKVQTLPIDCTLDFSELEYQGNHPFTQPVRVRGEVSVDANVVTLRAVAEFVYDSICDRCLIEIHQPKQASIEHVLVTSLTQEDDGELILVENHQLLLDDLILEDLILSLPSKNLCREDCRGLCMICGKDQSAGLCGCRSDSIDPRLAVLKQLTDQTD
ncbi:MAG TPA: nucleic acid-binding protein [Ruminococcaceae bacterium]|jgi:uncharacterized protein|nr:nucleic acid-binding protein [Oscillospiraceae bacterium]HCA29794.1 nucleic acid-binding protein [Oscillospiraceae bacterium]